jgi:hypothetical protein
MSGSGRTIGILMVVAGLIIGLVAAVWLLSGLIGEEIGIPGAVLGFGLALVLILPLIGAGIYLFIKGGREAQELAQIRQQRKILDMVQTQGQVSVSDVVLELGSSRDEVQSWIYDLVGKGLFSGYIKWDEGVLYSRDASLLKTNKCPHCGGQIELAGKGISKCPFCGTEIFLS